MNKNPNLHYKKKVICYFSLTLIYKNTHLPTLLYNTSFINNDLNMFFFWVIGRVQICMKSIKVSNSHFIKKPMLNWKLSALNRIFKRYVLKSGKIPILYQQKLSRKKKTYMSRQLLKWLKIIYNNFFLSDALQFFYFVHI